MRYLVNTFQKRKTLLSLIRRLSSLFLLSVASINLAFADGSVIDKVYHPYVDAMEKELNFVPFSKFACNKFIT